MNQYKSSIKAKSKVWLGIGISLLVLFSVMFFFSPKGTITGAESIMTYYYYANGTPIYTALNKMKITIGDCSSTSKCYSPSTGKCTDKGELHEKYKDYLCVYTGEGDSDWYQCVSGTKGVIKDQYLCTDSKWVKCAGFNVNGNYPKKGVYNFDSKTFYCNYDNWQTNTLICPYVIGSGKYTINNNNKLKIMEGDYFNVLGFIGCCSKKTDCFFLSSSGGNCYVNGTIFNNNLLCYSTSQEKDSNGLYLSNNWYDPTQIVDGTIVGKKFLQIDPGWKECKPETENDLVIISTSPKQTFVCRKGEWIKDYESCKTCTTNFCIFSDIYSYKNNAWTATQFTAESLDAITCSQVKNQCVMNIGGSKSLVSFDNLVTESKDNVCGNDGRWLKCDAYSDGQLSEGKTYICDGEISQWVKYSQKEDSTSICSDSGDNDGDDYTDCADSDCKGKTSDGKICIQSSILKLTGYEKYESDPYSLEPKNLAKRSAFCANDASCVKWGGTSASFFELTDDSKYICGNNNIWT